MSADQIEETLAQLDTLKVAARSLYDTAAAIGDAISAAEGIILADDVDPDADSSDLIGPEVGAILGAGEEAERAALLIRDILGD